MATPPVSSARRTDRSRVSSTSFFPFARTLARLGRDTGRAYAATIRESAGTPDQGIGVETDRGASRTCPCQLSGEGHPDARTGTTECPPGPPATPHSVQAAPPLTRAKVTA
ncbi:hypothetical protein GCM10010104_02690 [Streptomyces indiaensis]|uniref:Uncharacterized protein n=1 Tax=Streptomyces indiaensis TaxID=284033 RepID=A0ABP6HDD6_9ACTN